VRKKIRPEGENLAKKAPRHRETGAQRERGKRKLDGKRATKKQKASKKIRHSRRWSRRTLKGNKKSRMSKKKTEKYHCRPRQEDKTGRQKLASKIETHDKGTGVKKGHGHGNDGKELHEEKKSKGGPGKLKPRSAPKETSKKGRTQNWASRASRRREDMTENEKKSNLRRICLGKGMVDDRQSPAKKDLRGGDQPKKKRNDKGKKWGKEKSSERARPVNLYYGKAKVQKMCKKAQGGNTRSVGAKTHP